MKAKFLLPVIFILTALFFSSCQKCDHDEVVPNNPQQNTNLSLTAEIDRSSFIAGGIGQYFNVYLTSNTNLGYCILEIDHSRSTTEPTDHFYEYLDVEIHKGQTFVGRMLLSRIREVRVDNKKIHFYQNSW